MDVERLGEGQNVGDPFVIGQVDVPVGEYRRSAVMPAEPFIDDAFAGMRFEAGDEAGIGHEIEEFTYGQRRGS